MYEDFTLTFLITTLNLFGEVEFFNIAKKSSSVLVIFFKDSKIG